jgi:hypothetical protein
VKKTINWDGDSITDLIEIVKGDQFKGREKVCLSIIKCENPVPIKLQREFPNIAAIDSSGQCLLSITELTTESLANLRRISKCEKQLLEHVEFHYLFDTTTQVGDQSLIVGYLLHKNRFCLCCIQPYQNFFYTPADDNYLGLPTENMDVRWTVISPDNETLEGTTFGLTSASIQAAKSIHS